MLTRTQAILATIRRELERRAPQIDAAEGLAQVVITVKLSAESGAVRGIVWQDERVEARRYDAQAR